MRMTPEKPSGYTNLDIFRGRCSKKIGGFRRIGRVLAFEGGAPLRFAPQSMTFSNFEAVA